MLPAGSAAPLLLVECLVDHGGYESFENVVHIEQKREGFRCATVVDVIYAGPVDQDETELVRCPVTLVAPSGVSKVEVVARIMRPNTCQPRQVLLDSAQAVSGWQRLAQSSSSRDPRGEELVVEDIGMKLFSYRHWRRRCLPLPDRGRFEVLALLG